MKKEKWIEAETEDLPIGVRLLLGMVEKEFDVEERQLFLMCLVSFIAQSTCCEKHLDSLFDDVQKTVERHKEENLTNFCKCKQKKNAG